AHALDDGGGSHATTGRPFGAYRADRAARSRVAGAGAGQYYFLSRLHSGRGGLDAGAGVQRAGNLFDLRLLELLSPSIHGAGRPARLETREKLHAPAVSSRHALIEKAPQLLGRVAGRGVDQEDFFTQEVIKARDELID